MTITLMKFLSYIAQIKGENPTYQIRGTGSGGVCDCIGLVMGAMYRAGRAKYDLHSSNYFARCQMATFAPIGGSGALFLGEIVYKARSPTESGYDVNDRYLQSGRYWTGDLLDYYHVGIVTSLSPLTITHCTSGGGVNGITTDSKLGKWAYGGRLKSIDYDSNEGGTTTMATLYDAKVVTTGGILNIRAAASTSGKDLGDIPNGSLVQVLEETSSEWARVYWEGINGYVKREYLTKITGDTTDTTEDVSGTVTITLTAVEIAALKSILAKI